ncbi:MAG: hypothetical protein VXX85_04685 [Candidatus Margulisiibacteriota bacterium]|nr:hypothetical protein [Candidatus Margulisiibacteriota bacterium]
MNWVCLFIIVFCGSVVGVSPYIDYSNSNDIGFVNNHIGLGFSYMNRSLGVRLGVEYLNINTYGTVHNPNNSNVITEQTSFAVPIGIEKYWRIRPSLHAFLGLGYKFYVFESLASDSVDNIESVTAIGGEQIVRDYSEEIVDHIFYKLGISYVIYENVTVSCFKTWQLIKNNIAYTFLNDETVRQTSEINYDPITISVQYRF